MKKMRLTLSFAMLLGLLVSAAPSGAVVIGYAFNGTVSNSGVPGVSAGDTASGVFTYDTAVVDSDLGNNSLGRFLSGTTMSMTINGMTWSLGNGVGIVQDRTAPDVNPDTFFLGDNEITGPGAVSGVSTLGIQFVAPNTLFGSDSLPSISELLAMLGDGDDTATLALIGNEVLSVDIRSVRIVPEPGALALFGLGLAGIGFVRRRKTD